MKHSYSDSELEVARAAFRLAVKAVGSKRKLAQALEISLPAVSQWDVVPVARAAAVSQLSGVAVDMLCPGVAFPASGD